MNDARVDHIDETLAQLAAKVEGVSTELKSFATLDDLKAGFAKAFAQTQGGFEEFGRFAMFLDERLRREMSERFTHVDRRFDGMDEQFNRLEKLIKGRPIAPGKRSRSRR